MRKPDFSRLPRLSPDEIRRVQLGLLRQVVSFCREHGIRYYLASGTLLGAVRHQGFIPWDDDIDLLLPRPEYDRFVRLASEKPVGGNVDVLMPGRAGYYFPFVKVIDRRTRAVERGSTAARGVWIDLFPLDGVPSSERLAARQFRAGRVFRTLINSGNQDVRMFAESPKAAARSLIKPLVCLVGRARVARLAERSARRWKYDECECVGGVLWGYGAREKIRKSALEPARELPFEGERYAAPGCTEEMLTKYYGQYMCLPPESQRQGHGLTAYYV